ncbi:MAG TPA: efflux RND transporter permease subunit, partial [Desulfuromonadaceae bacterium]|nr:efflux RND transporter permease subunit [Desulfuromonadaceae bacterium]
MKSFTDLFIRRPLLATVISLLILIAGLQAIRSLNIRQYPRSENATVTVTTVYVGASANLVRGFVTQPLERAIAAADGIDYIESASKLSLSTITVHLRLNYDAKKALGEISSKVDQVRNELPPEAEIPTLSIVTADSQFASAYLSFSSDILQANQITDYLVRIVQPRLTAIEGVQKADLLGGRTFAMRIWLKPERLAALNISPDQIRQVLAANNFLSAVGHTKGSLVQVNLTANTDLRSVDEFKNLVVKQSGDQLVRLSDVADVVLGAEDYDSEVRFSGERAVFMGVWVLPNANSLDVIRKVRKELDSIQNDLPVGLKAKVAYDATKYISDALHEVVKTLLITLVIVSIVIFLFLGSWRSVVIPLVAIPLSLVGAVFLMQVFGFTLNLLTLLAIVLAVGLVVDDAIVVVENIERHVREGLRPVDAALAGARELIGPVIAMTITLAAVYAPIAFLGGLTGSLFREFAVTLAGAVFISGVVALTISPVMSSRLLDHDREEHGFAGRINRDFDRLRNFYGRVLDWTLLRRPLIYIVWIGLSFLTVVMFLFFVWPAKEPAPQEDQGVIFGALETAPNATIDQTSFYADVAGRSFAEVKEQSQIFQITFPDSGFGGMVMKPWGDRKRSVFQVAPEVQGMVNRIPGVRMYMVTPPPLPTGGEFMPVNIILQSTAEPEQILQFAQQLQLKCTTNGMFMFPPMLDTKMDQPEVELAIDRDKVAALGLNMQSVGSDLAALVGGNYVNRFNFVGRSYKVIPQLERGARLDASQLENTYVKGPGDQLIPVSTFAHLTNHVTPRALNRFQQMNSVKLSGVAMVPLEQALRFLEGECAKMLPSGYKLDYTGDSRFQRREGNSFLVNLLLAIVLIILVLAAQFNSFRDPFIIILGSVPLAFFGATMFCFLKMPNPNLWFFTNGWTTSLNTYSEVGLITLIGLIAKNGILIVQFANQLQLQGRTKVEAIREGAMLRLRPVLMTTVATIAGNIPLTLATGAGAGARNSIGIMLVAGMTIGTMFTLLVVPS